MSRARLALILLLLSGCVRFPALEGVATGAEPNAPFPALIPLDDLLAQARAPGTLAPPLPAGRIAGLAARADALRGPVIDRPTRARMQNGIDATALQ